MLPPTLNIQKCGDLCMVGGIYSDEKCKVCGSTLADNHRSALSCPNHPEEHATRFKVIFRSITRRFKSYESAQRFLTGLRYKVDEESFDPRDYRKDNPLGFVTLAEKWLKLKEQKVKLSTYRNLRRDIWKAMAHWKAKNVKDIGYPEIEDFIFSQEVSDKTKSNLKSALHDFWTWMRKRKVLTLAQMPEFPEISYELKFRKVIDKETQERILAEVHRISFDENPRVWLGIKWLATYIAIRPGELVKLKEGSIDLENGYLILTDTKEKKPKLVPLIEDDIALLKTFPKAMPHLFFFRHIKGNGGAKPGEKFGKDHLYNWWKKACKNLGIEGVDLYGGTRHSSAIALRKFRTPEEIKRATMHSTNKAFERYFRIESDDLRGIYEDTREKERADKPDGKTIKFPK
jgi:integrase